jgi:hypothetical protein
VEEKAARGEPTPRVAGSLGVDAEDLEGLVDALRRPAFSEAAKRTLDRLESYGA